MADPILADNDPDALAHAAAIAAEKLAEEQAANAAAGGTTTGEAGTTTGDSVVEGATGGAPAMVPLTVVDELRGKVRELEESNGVLKGLAIATLVRGPGAGGGAAREPVKTEAQQIEEELETLETQLNEGAIEFGDFNKQRRKLESRLYGLQNGVGAAAAGPAGDNIVLQERTDALTSANPWINNVPEIVIERSAGLAEMNAEMALGRALGDDDISTLALRKAYIDLGVTLGWDKQFAKPAAGTAGKSPTATAQPGQRDGFGTVGKPVGVVAKAAVAAGQPGQPEGANAAPMAGGKYAGRDPSTLTERELEELGDTQLQELSGDHTIRLKS